MATREAAGETRAEQQKFDIYGPDGATLDIRLTALFVLVARRWRALLDEQLRRIDQSAARMEAMTAIYNAPGEPAQVDIARRLRIEGPTLTRMLDTLEKDGLVQRLPGKGDRRSNHLRLTEQGTATLEQLFDVAGAFRSRLLDGVSQDDKERLNAVLLDMLERLDAGLPVPQDAAEG